MLAASVAALAGCQRASDPLRSQIDTPAECPDRIVQKSDDRAKTGYVQDLGHAALAGDDSRRVLYTGENLQLVLMTIQPSENIGAEIHADHDQFFRIEEGKGEAQINGVRTAISDASGIIVPAGALHDVVNTGKKPMRLFMIYSPPEYQRNMVRKAKEDADATVDIFDGCVTE